MKNYFFRAISLFVVVAGVALLTSCDKEDENKDLIVGNWTLNKVAIESMTIDGADFMTYYTETLGMSETEAQTYYDFMTSLMSLMTGSINIKDDGTYTSTMGDESSSGVWELSSDGNTLTTDKGTDDEMVATISELTESALKLSMTETDKEDMNGDDVEETTSMTMSMSFSK